MIEITLLPMGSRNVRFSKGFGQRIFQGFHPIRQRGAFIEGGKEVNVIGHNDIAANKDAACGGGFREKAEGLMEVRLGENGHAVVGTEGEEIEELVGKNSIEAGEARRMH